MAWEGLQQVVIFFQASVTKRLKSQWLSNEIMFSLWNENGLLSTSHSEILRSDRGHRVYVKTGATVIVISTGGILFKQLMLHHNCFSSHSRRTATTFRLWTYFFPPTRNYFVILEFLPISVSILDKAMLVRDCKKLSTIMILSTIMTQI